MAVVALTPQLTSEAGLTPTDVGSLSTSNTYTVKNSKPVLLHFKKSGAGICNVVFTSAAVVGEHKAISKTVAVPATTGDVFVGPFDPNLFQTGSDITFTLSEITGLTVSVIQLPLKHRRS
jgi:hypothetical protein